MNDWKIKDFFKVVLAIQFAVWGTIGLDTIGFQIPILRQLIGFIYLIFIPGTLILRILNLHKLGGIETLLYTVGLSIVTLMFTGLLINMVYPFFGISGPISITPLIITISVVVLGLCYISYKRDKDFSDPGFIDVVDILSPPALFLCLIPFLSIIGTYLMNFHRNNILLMFIIVITALIIILIGFNRFIPKNLYPLAVFVIAISLLFHRSLISMYITGWDIQYEHYLCNVVKMNSMWDPTMPMSYNAMLSIIILAPIYSIVSGMSIAWVFKIIYPVLFSLVPLGLYRIFQKQTNENIAFLSCFFFVSLFSFYGEMLALARQQIAELFLILLILLLIDKNMDCMKRIWLSIIFAFSLAVSHYGLSYIFMFSLIIVGGLLFLNTWRKSQDNVTKITITPRFVALYITFTLAWYMYVSSSSTFIAVVHIGDHIMSNIWTDFLNPEMAQGLGRIMEETVSPLHSVTKYLHLISQLFIAIGILTLLLKHKEMKFEKEYIIFSYVNFMICVAGIAVPFFASSLNTTRLYQITLIFLAPFCVIGGISFFKIVDHVIRKSWTDQIVRSSLKIISVFFAIFLFFNSGWVYEVANDHPMSISLNSSIDTLRYNIQEVSGVKWFSEVKNNKSVVYGDQGGWLLLNGVIGFDSAKQYDGNTEKISDDSYIYLRSLTARNKKIPIMQKRSIKEYISLQNSTFFKEVLIHKNKIYTNGGAQLYR